MFVLCSFYLPHSALITLTDYYLLKGQSTDTNSMLVCPVYSWDTLNIPEFMKEKQNKQRKYRIVPILLHIYILLIVWHRRCCCWCTKNEKNKEVIIISSVIGVFRYWSCISFRFVSFCFWIHLIRSIPKLCWSKWKITCFSRLALHEHESMCIITSAK